MTRARVGALPTRALMLLGSGPATAVMGSQTPSHVLHNARGSR